MRRAVLLLLIVLPSAACNSLQKKHDNPVMVQAPRRVTKIEPDAETQIAKASPDSETTAADDNQIQTASALNGESLKADPWANWHDDSAIYNSKVAATVNGAPILNGDVLDIYAGFLVKAREQMQYLWSHPEKIPTGQPRPTPEDFEQFREMLVKKDLAMHVQRRLLVERMKSSLKPDQIKAMNAHIDQLFDKRIEALKQELKVSTRTELELELNKKGTTLQNVKDNFATERLAMEYIVLKSEKPEPIDRLDLVAYYKEHLDDYAIPAKVKWEHIQVSFGPELSKSAAKKRVEAAQQELDGGAPFDQVAMKYSDGPTAKTGGQRDWMEAGNLTDTKLETKLFELPVGELSPPHEGPSEWQIVRIVERQQASRTLFGQVQDEIRKKIEDGQNKNRPKKLFEQLFSEAIIESKYDLPTKQQQRGVGL